MAGKSRVSTSSSSAAASDSASSSSATEEDEQQATRRSKQSHRRLEPKASARNKQQHFVHPVSSKDLSKINPRRTKKSISNNWLQRETNFEVFRSNLLVLPVPPQVKRIDRAKGFMLHIMSVMNWPLPESLGLDLSNPNLQQAEDAFLLTLGVHVSLFHGDSKRFFGNTWVSPELFVDVFGGGSIREVKMQKTNTIRHMVESVSLDLKAFFLSDVVDASCVGVVELVVYQKDVVTKATTAMFGVGWMLLPLFAPKPSATTPSGSALAPSFTTKTSGPFGSAASSSGESIKVFSGSPRALWETTQTNWPTLPKHEHCEFIYRLCGYDPIVTIQTFLRRNEIVGGLDPITGLKNGNLANLDLSKHANVALAKAATMSSLGVQQPLSKALFRDKLAALAKLASYVPRVILLEEDFTLNVVANQVTMHLREEIENNVVHRLQISRKSKYRDALSVDGEVTSRLLRIGLHNGRSFRTRLFNIPLKLTQNGSDQLVCVPNQTKLKGFVLNASCAVVLLLQFSVHFRIVWPDAIVKAKAKLQPPERLCEEEVVVVTMGARAICPTDGKKLFLYDKHAPTFVDNNDKDSNPRLAIGQDDHALADGDVHGSSLHKDNKPPEVESGVIITTKATAPHLHDGKHLQVNLLSGPYARPYSDYVIYTSPFLSGNSLEKKHLNMENSVASVVLQLSAEGSNLGTGQDSGSDDSSDHDKHDGMNQRTDQATSPLKQHKVSDNLDEEPIAAEEWARKMLQKANSNHLLAKTLDSLASNRDSHHQQRNTETKVQQSGTKSPSKSKQQQHQQSLAVNTHTVQVAAQLGSEVQHHPEDYQLSRASKTLLTRHGYFDALAYQQKSPSKSSSPRKKSNQTEHDQQQKQDNKDQPQQSAITRIKSIELELTDEFHHHEIRFHFAAIRFDTKQQEASAPQNVYLSFQFYNFPPTKTPTFALTKSSSNATYLLTQAASKTKAKASVALQFDVDTLRWHRHEPKEFAQYLLTKPLFVEVWDADSLLQVGTLQIPLRLLCRQGKAMAKFHGEFDIWEWRIDNCTSGHLSEQAYACVNSASAVVSSSQLVGKMQVLMSNFGSVSSELTKRRIQVKDAQQHLSEEDQADQEANQVNWRLRVGNQHNKIRVRARPLVDSNQELAKLLAKEGLYDDRRMKPLMSHRMSQRGESDLTSFSSREIDLLMTQWTNSPATVNSTSTTTAVTPKKKKRMASRVQVDVLMPLFDLRPRASKLRSEEVTGPSSVSDSAQSSSTPNDVKSTTSESRTKQQPPDSAAAKLSETAVGASVAASGTTGDKGGPGESELDAATPKSKKATVPSSSSSFRKQPSHKQKPSGDSIDDQLRRKLLVACCVYSVDLKTRVLENPELTVSTSNQHQEATSAPVTADGTPRDGPDATNDQKSQTPKPKQQLSQRSARDSDTSQTQIDLTRLGALMQTFASDCAVVIGPSDEKSSSELNHLVLECIQTHDQFVNWLQTPEIADQLFQLYVENHVFCAQLTELWDKSHGTTTEKENDETTKQQRALVQLTVEALDWNRDGKVSRADLDNFLVNKPLRQVNEVTGTTSQSTSTKAQPSVDDSQRTNPAEAKVSSPAIDTLHRLLDQARDVGVSAATCFEHFDKDKSGQVTNQVFQEALRSLSKDFVDLSSQATNELLAAIDPTNSGVITFVAFDNFMNHKTTSIPTPTPTPTAPVASISTISPSGDTNEPTTSVQSLKDDNSSDNADNQESKSAMAPSKELTPMDPPTAKEEDQTTSKVIDSGPEPPKKTSESDAPDQAQALVMEKENDSEEEEEEDQDKNDEQIKKKKKHKENEKEEEQEKKKTASESQDQQVDKKEPKTKKELELSSDEESAEEQEGDDDKGSNDKSPKDVTQPTEPTPDRPSSEKTPPTETTAASAPKQENNEEKEQEEAKQQQQLQQEVAKDPPEAARKDSTPPEAKEKAEEKADSESKSEPNHSSHEEVKDAVADVASSSSNHQPQQTESTAQPSNAQVDGNAAGDVDAKDTTVTKNPAESVRAASSKKLSADDGNGQESTGGSKAVDPPSSTEVKSTTTTDSEATNATPVDSMAATTESAKNDVDAASSKRDQDHDQAQQEAKQELKEEEKVTVPKPAQEPEKLDATKSKPPSFREFRKASSKKMALTQDTKADSKQNLMEPNDKQPERPDGETPAKVVDQGIDKEQVDTPKEPTKEESTAPKDSEEMKAMVKPASLSRQSSAKLTAKQENKNEEVVVLVSKAPPEPSDSRQQPKSTEAPVKESEQVGDPAKSKEKEQVASKDTLKPKASVESIAPQTSKPSDDASAPVKSDPLPLSAQPANFKESHENSGKPPPHEAQDKSKKKPGAHKHRQAKKLLEHQADGNDDDDNDDNDDDDDDEQQLVFDCGYNYSNNLEVRGIERKLRRGILDAFQRKGIVPSVLLAKYQRQHALARVDLIQLLMEIGFSVLEPSAYDEEDHACSVAGSPLVLRDQVYARQLERLRQYKKTTGLNKKAPRQLVQATRRHAATSSMTTGPGKHASDVKDTGELTKFLTQKDQVFRVLQFYRDGMKKTLVHSLLRQQVTKQCHLFVSFGQTVFFECPFTNPYNHLERFRIEWDLAQIPSWLHVRLVQDVEEWKYLRAHVPDAWQSSDGSLDNTTVNRSRTRTTSRSSPAVEKDMIDDQNELVVDGNDHVPIPFCVTCLFHKNPSAMQRSLQQDMNKTKWTICILFKSVAHGQIVTLVKLHLHVVSFVCHRTLRFFAPASSLLRQRLRILCEQQQHEFLTGSSSGDSKHRFLPISDDLKHWPDQKFVLCIDPSVVIETTAGPGNEDEDPDGTNASADSRLGGQELFLKCRVGEYPSVVDFHLILYEDPYHAVIYEIWHVRIQSLLRLDLHSTMGQSVRNELVIRGDDIQRRVKCYSSSPQEIYFNPSNVFQLASSALNRIQLSYCSMVPGQKHALLNLVDIETRELVGAWILLVATQEPVVTKCYDLVLPVGVASQKKISYQNPWDEDQEFVLRSSDLQVMRPRNQRLRIVRGESEFIRLWFAPTPWPMDRKVFLFINDNHTDQNDECLAFRITWVDDKKKQHKTKATTTSR